MTESMMHPARITLKREDDLEGLDLESLHIPVEFFKWINQAFDAQPVVPGVTTMDRVMYDAGRQAVVDAIFERFCS